MDSLGLLLEEATLKLELIPRKNPHCEEPDET
jgi:hypothetical protein